jgi:hypothetical protein
MCSTNAANPVPTEDHARIPLTTPVVFVVFNRPDCTAKSLAPIRAARPARLYVVADGPRPDRPGEAARCAEVRALVEEGIDWPCEVIRDYAPANLGCARRVASGLDAVFAREPEAIILEDDCVADPTFFPFCAELLVRCRNQAEVCHIGGANFQETARPGTYYFSRYNHVWGWAAWKRSWELFDWEMKDWPSLRETNWLRDLLEDRWAARYWRDGFDSVVAGRVDSWAYRWTYAIWRHGGLSVLPGVNLVANIGFGLDGTHARRSDHWLSRPATAMPFPLRHPATVARDQRADLYTERTLYSGGFTGLLRRSASRIVQRLKS